MEKIQKYRGHSIILGAYRNDVGWVGKYSVSPLECQDTHSHSDSLPGHFPSEETADQAALKAAKQWIDRVHKT